MSPEDVRLATAVVPVGGRAGRYRADVDPGWNVPLGMHGGVLVATALQAAREAVDAPELTLRSAHASFTARPGSGDLVLDAHPRRRGGTTAHVDVSVAELSRADVEVLALRALFTRARTSAGFTDVRAPDVPGPDDGDDETTRWTEGSPGPLRLPPLFTHLEVRRAEGFVPWDERWRPGADARYVRWNRYRIDPVDDGGVVDPVALLPLADLPGPSLWTRFGLDEPFYALVSLELTVHLLQPATDPWILTDFRTRWMGDGYALTTCDLWSAGRLVATSEQMMLARVVEAETG